MRTITESESTPKADGFYMPAEWAKQKRVWMGWPHRTDTWAHGAKPAQKHVPDPFHKGKFVDRPAKEAHYKIKVKALKGLKDMA